jgi:hypothetical protein
MRSGVDAYRYPFYVKPEHGMEPAYIFLEDHVYNFTTNASPRYHWSSTHSGQGQSESRFRAGEKSRRNSWQKKRGISNISIFWFTLFFLV